MEPRKRGVTHEVVASGIHAGLIEKTPWMLWRFLPATLPWPFPVFSTDKLVLSFISA
jgi:hypothetical protein